MNVPITVIVPTHNPNPVRLQRTLAGLRSQSLANWELILVDNASTHLQPIDLSWHSQAMIVQEPRLGLTRARVAGIQASQGQILVFVDDDNVLAPDYLEQTMKILRQHPQLGAIGGKSIPEFEIEPEPWTKEFWGCLALRDLGDTELTYVPTANTEKQHPSFAPIGAGMAIQRTAADDYVSSILDNAERLALDRTGKSLQSGGDCDINLTLIGAGWGVGYFPQLQLTHLISANRLTKDYLAQISYASYRSWIQVLDAHDLRPWQQIPAWSVLPRKFRAFLRYRAWMDAPAYIHWRGACGMFEGLGALKDDRAMKPHSLIL